jgi:hypothetical protein
MLNKRLSVLLSCLLLVFVCSSAVADVTVTLTPPPARERDMPPRGYLNCHMAPAGFYNGQWHNMHRVCKYPGGVWISGYWQCLHYKHHSGICTNWGWVPSHWEKQHRPVAYVQPGPVIVQPAPVVVQPVPVVQPLVQVSLGNNNNHHHHGHGHH